MRVLSRLGLVLTAARASSGLDASDDTLVLLQTKSAVIQEDGHVPVVDTSLDKAFKGSPPDCQPALRMDIGKSTVVYSNLGNMGPDSGPEGILYRNVLADSGDEIDLHVSALSSYTPKQPQGNGKVASFGRINVATGTNVATKFSFYESGTQTPVIMKPFTMSFVDLDEQRDEGMGREYITIMDEHEYILTKSSTVLVTREDGQTTFSSSTYGSGQDNPRGAMALTKAQKDKSVQVVFPEIASFSVTLTAGAHPAHWSGNSRNILFAGQTNMWCEPDEPLPTGALCASMECPSGFKQKGKKKLAGVFCAGEDCTVEDDTKTCCTADLCSNTRLLTLSDDNIIRNNLGNQGPDSGAEGILFNDVFPHRGETIKMLLSAAEGYEKATKATNNARGNIASINLVTGGRADLTFKFFDENDKPVKVGPFYISFLDFDEHQKEGKAREYLTINSFKKYVLDDNTVVRAIATNDDESSMTFHSTTFGIGKDNVRNSKKLTDEQKTKAVSVLIGKGKQFTARFEVSPVRGSSGRFLQIAGATNQVC